MTDPTTPSPAHTGTARPALPTEPRALFRWRKKQWEQAWCDDARFGTLSRIDHVDIHQRRTTAEAELWAAAPSRPGEIDGWPGGWMLRSPAYTQWVGPGLLGAWRTQLDALNAALDDRSTHAETLAPVWTPIVPTLHGGVGAILDDQYWNEQG